MQTATTVSLRTKWRKALNQSDVIVRAVQNIKTRGEAEAA